MTLNLPLLYVLWLEEYCQISPNKNKSPNLWHVTSILVCCIFVHRHPGQFVVPKMLGCFGFFGYILLPLVTGCKFWSFATKLVFFSDAHRSDDFLKRQMFLLSHSKSAFLRVHSVWHTRDSLIYFFVRQCKSFELLVLLYGNYQGIERKNKLFHYPVDVIRWLL
jgi:hypothetical protein